VKIHLKLNKKHFNLKIINFNKNCFQLLIKIVHIVGIIKIKANTNFQNVNNIKRVNIQKIIDKKISKKLKESKNKISS